MDFEGRIQGAGLAQLFPRGGEAVQIQPGAQLNAGRATLHGGVHALQVSAADFQGHFDVRAVVFYFR